MAENSTPDPGEGEVIGVSMSGSLSWQGGQTADVEAFTHDLARHIQQAVEDWFEDRGTSGWADLDE